MSNEHYIFDDGRQIWYQNGAFHRLDGPAVTNTNGDFQAWWIEGKLHRIDGPAYINGDYQEWWQNGKLHRIDGPAIISGNYQMWYIEGKRYTKEEFDEKLMELYK